MQKTLEGLKVVEFTLAAAGPTCSKQLVEWGAESVILEPLTGCTSRFAAPHLFDFYHSGKRSVAVDLKTPEGQEIMQRLIREADIFVANYRPKALKSLHMTYEDLIKINPRLIHATLTGYGEEGPCAPLPGHDTVSFWARGGVLLDFAERGTVLPPPISVGDSATGQALLSGILAALYHREKTGKGMKVWTSLFSEAIYLNNDCFVELQYGGQYPKSRIEPMRSLLNTYKCSDGKWIVLLTVNFEKDFDNMLRCLGHEEMVGDPRWTCIADTMNEGAPEMVRFLDGVFAAMTQDEAIERLESVDFACARVTSTEDLFNDPQAIVNHYIREYTNSDGKKLKVPATPVKFGDLENEEMRLGPCLGEHTADVMKEVGFSNADIEEYLKKNAVAITDKKVW